jgi:hypothetical protein
MKISLVKLMLWKKISLFAKLMLPGPMFSSGVKVSYSTIKSSLIGQ